MKDSIGKRLSWILAAVLVVLFLLVSLSQAESSDDANKLVNQYMQLYKEGRYPEAIPIAEKAFAIREKTLGPNHPDTAESLNNLASLYENMGDYAKAVPLYKRALAIVEQSLGPEHSIVAYPLNNLAVLYIKMGEYEKAELLCKRALAIREQSLGPDHPGTATTLNNLALLYDAMGDYAKAVPVLKRSVAIREKVFGPDHADTATTLNNLASLYEAMGDYAKAVPLYRRSLAIREKTLGPNHPDTADSLNNLALLYDAIGDYAKAEPLLKRSLAIYERAFGPDHLSTAHAINNIAELYQAMGDYAKAEPLLKRSLTIREKALGPNHPDIEISLNNLAVICVKTSRQDEAFHFMLRAQGIDAKLIDQVMGFTSEDQKIKFLGTKEHHLYAFLSLASRNFRDDKDAMGRALTVWLQRKGVVLEAQKRFQDVLTLSDDPDMTRKAQELAGIRAQLSKLTFSGPGKDRLDVYEKKIKELQEQKGKLEAELSKISDAFARTRKVAKADTKQVSDALPKGSFLIDFVKLPIFNFTARSKDKRWLPPHYYAFILPSGRPDSVSLIDLGGSGEIDRLIGEFKKNVTNLQGDPEGKEVSRISRRLHDCVFSPLSRKLKDTKEVYISPDGNLNLIPFEVLQGPDGKYLIEDYTFNYLGSGRDILGFGLVKGTPSKPLIIGDPDYNLDEAGHKDALKKLGITPEKRSIVMRSRDLSSKEFSPLPGTREEVESITALLGKNDAALYTDRNALEEVLMKHRNPKVLHLATHGFFLSDQDLLDKRRKIPYENPLARSGIVLAGANRSMKSGSDEGIVTAEKILSLRLHGTDLVVLSACETGLGDVKNGEGVFGLRRAFTQAGTKGIVMSLWSVPDRETKELMIDFYTNVFVKGMKRPEALRQAILTELSETKKRYGTTNPFFWGAFVYLGEP